MVGTPGHDVFLDLCDAETLEDQPSQMAELVLRSVCQLWRQSTRRCGRILAVEFFDRSTFRIAEFDRWQLEREFLLTLIVRHRGLPPVSGPPSPSPYRKLLHIALHAALLCPHLRRMFTSILKIR